MTASVAPPKLLRASHRRLLQLFRTYGAMSDQEALETANADGWAISPSGLRSRRAELTPPRGRGIKDSGLRKKTQIGIKPSVIWTLDSEVSEPWAGRS